MSKSRIEHRLDRGASRFSPAAGALLALTITMLVAACAAPAGKRSALRPIDAVAMQGTVERVAKMLVPGAVVILRTPTGRFTSTLAGS